MSERKLTINFHDSGKAKAFAQKAKKVPGVTYATDCCRSTGSYLVFVWGHFSDEVETRLKSKRI